MIELPYESNRYRCIECDPPWMYNDTSKGMNGWQSDQRYRIHPAYPTMPLDDIRAMGDEINRVAAEKCHLWLWTTKDFLPESFAMVAEWGWTYKQLFTWVKMNRKGGMTYGMGYWCRNACEYLILAVNTSKGNRPLKATTTPNYIFAPRGRHSAKPREAYRIIRENSPGPRLSIFQRVPRKGFDCFGNQMIEGEQTTLSAAPIGGQLILPFGETA